MDLSRIVLFSGGSCPELAQAIASKLGVPLSSAKTTPFADGEPFAQLNANVRGRHVFIIQSTYSPADNLMQLLVMIDAAKRASAAAVTAVMPYFGCARQDRKKEGRVPITARLVADLLATAGASRVVTAELHAAQIQGFFNIPCDHLYMYPVMVPEIKRIVLSEREEYGPDTPLALVSSDVNGGKMVRNYRKFRFPGDRVVIIDKERSGHGQSRVNEIYGDPKGCICIVLDDMVDGAGSIIGAAEALLDAGARVVYGIAAHPVFSGDAVGKIERSCLKSLVVGDTIPVGTKAGPGSKIKVCSFADVFAPAIEAITTETSVSDICFEQR
ncbi:MAG: ribose-phosphate diphosphokinase [Patescibacteria group bacterium]|jgi:ribose-phosphate pyrophosphokinase